MASTGERPLDSKPIVILQEDNYIQWRWDIRAVLRSIGALGIVDATDETVDKALSNKAAGLIMRSLSVEQQVHITDTDSPDVMWTELEAAHNKKLPAVRFNAYNELFSIRKEADESLTKLTSRI